MKRKFIIFLLAGTLLGIAGGKWYNSYKNTASKNTEIGVDTSKTITKSKDSLVKIQNNIPAKVYEILKYIETFHEPKPGYKGGSEFHNFEKLLPRKSQNGKPIRYLEWDVNPKSGILKRGKERLVTGNDKSAWYTNDHYKSFIKIH